LKEALTESVEACAALVARARKRNNENKRRALGDTRTTEWQKFFELLHGAAKQKPSTIPFPRKIKYSQEASSSSSEFINSFNSAGASLY
jgi:hypothetical protein